MKKLLTEWRNFLKEETIPLGQCYPFAVKMAKAWSDAMIDRTKPPGKGVHPDIDNKDKFKVVHGRITDKFSGESVLHAWVEKPGLVFDEQTSHTKPEGVPRDVWYEMFQPEAHKEYTAEEAMLTCTRQRQMGPWD